MPDKRSIALLLLAAVLLSCILTITYGLERSQTSPLLFIYSLAFAVYVGMYKLVNQEKQIWWLLGFSILIRILLLPAIPNLSDDIYRFIWDGRLLIQGIHPFAYLPSEIIERGIHTSLSGIDEALFQKLNSPDYFSIYPPVNQAIFAIAGRVFPESVMGSTVFIRLCILIAEAGSLYLLFRFAGKYATPHTTEQFRVVDIQTETQAQSPWGMPPWKHSSPPAFRQAYFAASIPIKRVLLYSLNPLIILELSGNLHFEALMIFFLLLSYFFIEKDRWLISSFFFALAICTKLLPLILLPLYLRRLGMKRAIQFYIATAVITLLLFLPLLNVELIRGISESIGLYFQKFEFNASIYYVVREIGYINKGYNTIETSGIKLAISAFLGIILFSILERNSKLPTAWIWVWVIYLAFATIVHPWYIAPLIAFSIFTHYRFMIVWSWLIFFSYAGYTADGFEEILSITVIEYILVGLVLVYELWRNYSGKTLSSGV